LWAIVYFGHFFENLGSSIYFWASYVHIYFDEKIDWAPFRATFSQTHRVTLLQILMQHFPSGI
jgi:hypothetical protein